MFLWGRAYAWNVRLYPYWQYTNLFIFYPCSCFPVTIIELVFFLWRITLFLSDHPLHDLINIILDVIRESLWCSPVVGGVTNCCVVTTNECCISCDRSLINSKNNTGPRTLPCETRSRWWSIRSRTFLKSRRMRLITISLSMSSRSSSMHAQERFPIKPD